VGPPSLSPPPPLLVVVVAMLLGPPAGLLPWALLLVLVLLWQVLLGSAAAVQHLHPALCLTPGPWWQERLRGRCLLPPPGAELCRPLSC
jgi:hypothetical protein